jgi:hypothetical protein
VQVTADSGKRDVDDRRVDEVEERDGAQQGEREPAAAVARYGGFDGRVATGVTSMSAVPG